jgi:hypothetical protein
MPYTCNKCSDYGQDVKLIGDVFTNLCYKHRNEFTDFMNQNALFIRYTEIENPLNIVGSKYTKTELLKFAKEIFQPRFELYKISASWINK